MSIRKREFLTGLGLTAAGMTGALAQSYPKGKDLGAVAPAPKKDICLLYTSPSPRDS